MRVLFFFCWISASIAVVSLAFSAAFAQNSKDDDTPPVHQPGHAIAPDKPAPKTTRKDSVESVAGSRGGTSRGPGGGGSHPAPAQHAAPAVHTGGSSGARPGGAAGKSGPGSGSSDVRSGATGGKSSPTTPSAGAAEKTQNPNGSKAAAKPKAMGKEVGNVPAQAKQPPPQ